MWLHKYLCKKKIHVSTGGSGQYIKCILNNILWELVNTQRHLVQYTPCTLDPPLTSSTSLPIHEHWPVVYQSGVSFPSYKRIIPTNKCFGFSHDRKVMEMCPMAVETRKRCCTSKQHHNLKTISEMFCPSILNASKKTSSMAFQIP